MRPAINLVIFGWVATHLDFFRSFYQRFSKTFDAQEPQGPEKVSASWILNKLKVAK